MRNNISVELFFTYIEKNNYKTGYNSSGKKVNLDDEGIKNFGF